MPDIAFSVGSLYEAFRVPASTQQHKYCPVPSAMSASNVT